MAGWEPAAKELPALFKGPGLPPALPAGGPPPLGKRSHEVDYEITGESLFMTHFTNRGAGKKRVAFAAPYPGTVLPVDLSQLGGELLCQKDAFLCAAMGTQVGIALNKKLGAGLFGGEGFILQRITGMSASGKGEGSVLGGLGNMFGD